MADRLNVLYLITHDQGIAAASFAKFGPSASARMQTPNLDRLAENGVILTMNDDNQIINIFKNGERITRPSYEPKKFIRESRNSKEEAKEICIRFIRY
jgi:hypothetical protein